MFDSFEKLNQKLNKKRSLIQRNYDQEEKPQKNNPYYTALQYSLMKNQAKIKR